MGRRVDSRKGEALDETPRTLGSDGWGVVVRGRESRPQGDAYPRRRPLAFGKTGAKVPSERASCPQVDAWGAGEMRRNASWGGGTTEMDRRCEAECGESVRRVTHRRNCHQRWPEFRVHDSEANN